VFTQRIIQKLYHKKIVCEKIILINLKKFKQSEIVLSLLYHTYTNLYIQI